MIDLKFIRQNQDLVRRAIEQKCISLDLSALLEVDQRLLNLRSKAQLLEEQKNSNAKKVPGAPVGERAAFIQKGKEIATELERMQPELQALKEELQQLLWLVPLPPSPDAPIGATDEENVELRHWSNPTKFDFLPKDHVQLLSDHDWAELERAAKISGARSYALKNECVLLEMALHRLAMDRLIAKGFTLVTVPAMARETAFYGTGHF